MCTEFWLKSIEEEPTWECACKLNDNIEMKMTGDVTPFNLVDHRQYFKGTSCPPPCSGKNLLKK
jgi:hypothetical protein